MSTRPPEGEPDPAADLLGRWQAHHEGTTPEPREPLRLPRPSAVPPPAPGASTDVEFPQRNVLRRALGLLLLLASLATVAAGVLAYLDPGTLTVGLAATLGVLSLALYGVRAGTVPVRLAIHAGQLEVVRGRTREVFDLTSRFTRLEVVGRPGRRGWKVLMARFGRDPLVIDSSMVDPADFTEALEQHRPADPSR